MSPHERTEDSYADGVPLELEQAEVISQDKDKWKQLQKLILVHLVVPPHKITYEALILPTVFNFLSALASLGPGEVALTPHS